MRDGVSHLSFSTPGDARQFLSTLDDDELENIAVFIFTYVPQADMESELEYISNHYIPFSRKVALLNSDHANKILLFNNLIALEKFLFFPVDEQILMNYTENLIEQYLENKILRRSLSDIRETYETMKTQFHTIQESNLRLDKKIMELSTLSEIGSDLMSTYDPDEIYRETVLTLMGQKGASSVMLFHRDEDDNFLEVKFSRGIPKELNVNELKFHVDSPLINCLFKFPRAQFIDSIDFPPMCAREMEQLNSFGTQIVIPLINKSQRKGFILLGNRITNLSYSDDDFEFFSILANQMIFALENAQLYEKLEAKIEELEKANKELRFLDKMKSEFITIASHELRTPLTAVRGYAELLISGKFDSLSENQFKAISVMNKNVDRLIQISDDVVQLSKIDANRISINLIPTAVEKIVQTMVEESKLLAQSRNLSLHVEIAKECPVVLVDPKLIHQALSELIKNAIRFTPDGGNIWVVVRQITADDIQADFLPEHHFGSFLQVSVSDDGIGIPTDEHSHIFERFYEVQHSNFHHSGSFGFKSGGTGLGLSIVKGIVEKHGGKIWVESGDKYRSRGSNFTFIIPTPSFS